MDLTHAIVEAAKALVSYASAKNRKGYDSTARGNIKEWGHTNKSKTTNEHTKQKPGLNTQVEEPRNLFSG